MILGAENMVEDQVVTTVLLEYLNIIGGKLVKSITDPDHQKLRSGTALRKI
jgi:hypothetical protein